CPKKQLHGQAQINNYRIGSGGFVKRKRPALMVSSAVPSNNRHCADKTNNQPQELSDKRKKVQKKGRFKDLQNHQKRQRYS
ncbi:MAG TPA: hypothetical protein VF313_02180, partial [Anaerolineaceae bacterium]